VDTENDSAVIQFSCPKCGSLDIRRARSQGAWAAFLRVFGRWPFRCRSCRQRFYLASGAREDDV